MMIQFVEPEFNADYASEKGGGRNLLVFRILIDPRTVRSVKDSLPIEEVRATAENFRASQTEHDARLARIMPVPEAVSSYLSSPESYYAGEETIRAEQKMLGLARRYFKQSGLKILATECGKYDDGATYIRASIDAPSRATLKAQRETGTVDAGIERPHVYAPQLIARDDSEDTLKHVKEPDTLETEKQRHESMLHMLALLKEAEVPVEVLSTRLVDEAYRAGKETPSKKDYAALLPKGEHMAEYPHQSLSQMAVDMHKFIDKELSAPNKRLS